MAQSHYPSSAELAAFRRSIGPQWLVNPPTGYNGLATSDELQHGIGYHPFNGDGPSYLNTDSALYTYARAKASRMRSATYYA